MRDFIEDNEGWLYAVAAYDNDERVGCVLRYIPAEAGERVNRSGHRFTKLDFEQAYTLIAEEKPQYMDMLHRVPVSDVRRVLKPEEEFPRIVADDERVRELQTLLDLPFGAAGCTGSLLLGLDTDSSDIDLVVYGKKWFEVQERLSRRMREGRIRGLSEEMWRRVYEKRKPEINFESFIVHEQRKWNRGEIGGTYFDLLYTRPYETLCDAPTERGKVLGKMTIVARVIDASLSFDSPAIYRVEHEKVNIILSFTHTYSGQARIGEVIEACGVCESHGDEIWLIVGTTREARGEYIESLSLLEK
ncbi:MAG: DNA polymerase subunit beta [Methanoregulaceae archaeon]|nr:DNA polymerase subunit beta [Methanoregulaceae archaeon]